MKFSSRFFIGPFLFAAIALQSSLVFAAPPVGSGAGFGTEKYSSGNFIIETIYAIDKIPLRARSNKGNDFYLQRSMLLAHMGWLPTERSELYLLLGTANNDLDDKADGVSPSPNNFDGNFDALAGFGGKNILWKSEQNDLRVMVDGQLLLQNNIGFLEGGGSRRSLNYDAIEWSTSISVSTLFENQYRPYAGLRVGGIRLSDNSAGNGFGDLDQRNRVGAFAGVSIPYDLSRKFDFSFTLEGRVIDTTGASFHANFLF